MSFASAEAIAQQYPQYADQITAAAKSSFLAGDQNAYIAGIIAILIGLTLVFLKYPKKDEEQAKLAAISCPRDRSLMAAHAPVWRIDASSSQPVLAPVRHVAIRVA